MSNKKITDLTELTTPTTDDVFPIVDIATNTTQKVQVGNLPIQTAVTTALATKQATLVSGTNIKTVNSTTLLGSGDIAVQPTLVSGTNIKTLNSVSLLGSGDIVLAATPSGVAGAIQFSNGSAFASDATNFFWDDTNNRLGVGTDSGLIAQAHFQNNTSLVNEIFVGSRFATSGTRYDGVRIGTLSNATGFIQGNSGLNLTSAYPIFLQPNGSDVGIGFSNISPTARLHIKGSGSTSATTSLLVQNSAGSERYKILDDGTITFNGGLAGTGITISSDGSLTQNNNATGITAAYDGGFKLSGGVGSFIRNATGYNKTLLQGGYDGGLRFSANSAASDYINLRNDTTALLEMVSTTKGFLPPRMTTTQKNAIATPAAGLVVYDNTTNKLCCYDGSTWNDLF